MRSPGPIRPETRRRCLAGKLNLNSSAITHADSHLSHTFMRAQPGEERSMKSQPKIKRL